MLKESIIFPLRSIQSKTYVWFDIVGLTNKTTGKKNKPVDSSPGKQKRKAKLLCSLLSFSWDWKVNWPREVSYGIWRGNFIALSVLEDHGKGYQVPGVMWSQLWRLLLMGNGAENTLLVSLDCAARAWGCCFLLRCDSPGASPVQVWLHTGTMQVPQVPLNASRTVRFYCLEAKKCLNKSWHEIWATFQNKGMKILPSWRAEFQLCATTCVLTLQLWLPHCFSRSSFHWQLSPLSSLLTPASHASFSSIGPFHFPHLLFPMFFLPILLLWCFTKILCQLERSLTLAEPKTHPASFQQTKLVETKARSGMAIQKHQQNTQS